MVQSRVAASSAAWGWQGSERRGTIPKSFGFEAATRYEASRQCYPKSGLFEPCPVFRIVSVEIAAVAYGSFAMTLLAYFLLHAS
jgi:hypothetical protein